MSEEIIISTFITNKNKNTLRIRVTKFKNQFDEKKTMMCNQELNGRHRFGFQTLGRMNLVSYRYCLTMYEKCYYSSSKTFEICSFNYRSYVQLPARVIILSCNHLSTK